MQLRRIPIPKIAPISVKSFNFLTAVRFELPYQHRCRSQSHMPVPETSKQLGRVSLSVVLGLRNTRTSVQVLPTQLFCFLLLL